MAAASSQICAIPTVWASQSHPGADVARVNLSRPSVDATAALSWRSGATAKTRAGSSPSFSRIRGLRHVARLPSSASPSTRPEQAEVEPNRDENEEPLDDRRYERRHMIEDQAVADHCDSQRPEHRAKHRAAAAEQARSAQHDCRNDIEFEAG